MPRMRARGPSAPNMCSSKRQRLRNVSRAVCSGSARVVRWAAPLVLMASCREPTEIVLDIRTDADCRDVSSTTITIGTLADFERRPPTTSTTACTPETQEIGTLTVVPRDEKDAEVALRVVTGFGKTPDQCVRDGYKGGCIVARRVLHYRPHHSIDLPILMEASCMDVPCDTTNTCRAGQCVPATLGPTVPCNGAGCSHSGGAGGASSEGSGGDSAFGGVGGMGSAAGAPPAECSPACANAHGTTRCVAGVCEPECEDGYDDCDGIRENGCEASLNDAETCGSCETKCPAGDGVATCTAKTCAVSCPLTGTYALKIALQATWPSSSFVTSGEGTFRFWLKFTGTQTGEQLDGTLLECGREFPDFRSKVVNETMLLSIPNALFDQVPPYLTPVPVGVHVGGRSPGATFSLPLTGLLMGTSMSDPVSDLWPDSASRLKSVDVDGDGKAGVTVSYRNDLGYVYPRTSGSLNAGRATSAFLASRLVFALDGTLTSCKSAGGAADVRFVDTRIFGCNREAPGDECSSNEADFLDANCVDYTLGSAEYSLIRVPDDASCPVVRAAL